MSKTIEVEIDSEGRVHALQPSEVLPAGRALLTVITLEDAEGLLLSERALSDWLRLEEDEAWADFQQDR